ncbi:MAG: hypothetical protein GY842_19165 [bacterium]|nr:hypothetical protein [bacterium]
MKNESMKWVRRTMLVVLAGMLVTAQPVAAQSYVVVDTGQTACYDGLGNVITCPAEGEPG